MHKTTFIILVIAIMGLCAVLPVSGQSPSYARGNEANLGLLLVVNRLELTSGQMRQIHDILSGILDETSRISEKREAFTQEMLRFDGSAEKLDLRLEAFRIQMEAELSALKENTRSALDELGTILTLKQGDILRNNLRMFVAKRLTKPGEEGNETWQRMRTQIAPESREECRQRVRELRKRFASQEEEAAAKEFSAIRSQTRQRLMENGLHMRGRLLQQIVDILESKLALSSSN